ncbi:hypothetical protein [Peribacillus alkalitolerans]|uniref:hypothetical protein n=1 Tax=Peribacillus alkalitolerans TaxID=1550385 RepID=UPI0013CFC495|nr:hypothetical protein [Peribacillus alkalitolerans]
MSVRDNKGITLVGVLLIIVIISLLGMTLASLIVNNMQQIKKSEKDIQVNDVAEMGIQYQAISFSDFYTLKVHEITTAVKEQIKTDFNTNVLKSNEQYEEMIGSQLLNAIKQNTLFYSSTPNKLLLTKNVDVMDERKFDIFFENPGTDLKCVTCGSTEAGEVIKIAFISKGSSKTYSGNKTIKSTLNMKIGALTINPGGGSGGGTGGGNTQPPQYETIVTKPVNLPTCTDTNSFGTKDCAYQGTITINNPQDITNVDIIINGSLIAYKPLNKGVENSTLYVTGDTDFYDPINGIHDSNIFIGGDAQFKNINQGINNTTIVIMGRADFNVDGNINGMFNSTIYVRGDADFHDKHINSFSSNAKICVGGKVSGVPSNTNYNIYSPTINNAKFIEKCGRTGGLDDSGIGIDWDIDTSDITYEYN